VTDIASATPELLVSIKTNILFSFLQQRFPCAKHVAAAPPPRAYKSRRRPRARLQEPPPPDSSARSKSKQVIFHGIYVIRR
jgi:hypothetical protein